MILLFALLLFFQVTLVLAACSFASHFDARYRKINFILEAFAPLYIVLDCYTSWTHSFITNNEFCCCDYLFLVKCLSNLFSEKWRTNLPVL